MSPRRWARRGPRPDRRRSVRWPYRPSLPRRPLRRTRGHRPRRRPPRRRRRRPAAGCACAAGPRPGSHHGRARSGARPPDRSPRAPRTRPAGTRNRPGPSRRSRDPSSPAVRSTPRPAPVRPAVPPPASGRSTDRSSAHSRGRGGLFACATARRAGRPRRPARLAVPRREAARPAPVPPRGRTPAAPSSAVRGPRCAGATAPGPRRPHRGSVPRRTPATTARAGLGRPAPASVSPARSPGAGRTVAAAPWSGPRSPRPGRRDPRPPPRRPARTAGPASASGPGSWRSPRARSGNSRACADRPARPGRGAWCPVPRRRHRPSRSTHVPRCCRPAGGTH